jgi:hypothetical protein
MKEGEDNYVIEGKNRIRVRLGRFGDCIRDVAVLQTTDVKHAIVRITNVRRRCPAGGLLARARRNPASPPRTAGRGSSAVRDAEFNTFP